MQYKILVSEIWINTIYFIIEISIKSFFPKEKILSDSIELLSKIKKTKINIWARRYYVQKSIKIYSSSVDKKIYIFNKQEDHDILNSTKQAFKYKKTLIKKRFKLLDFTNKHNVSLSLE